MLPGSFPKEPIVSEDVEIREVLKMKITDVNQYDGCFDYNGRIINYNITDNNYPIKEDKLSRYIHFYENGTELGFKVIYGHVDKMLNITHLDAEEWFEEFLKNVN